MILVRTIRQRWHGFAIVTALLTSGTLASCGGENFFGGDGLSPDDSTEPSIAIESPDSGQRVAVGDSVFIEVEATDDQGIAQIELSGFAVSGSSTLGTRELTPRFAPKVVDLGGVQPVVRDTVLLRYLLPIGDSIPADTVLLIARVTDRAGNESADTVYVGVGGPRVHITSPVSGAQVRPGAQLVARISAADTANPLQSIRLRSTGAVTLDTLVRFDPPRAEVDTLVALNLPAGAPTGTMVLSATARNVINDSTTSAAVQIQVLPPSEDTRAPTVRFSTSSRSRVETRDTLTVTVSAQDSVRVDRVGATLLVIQRLSTGTDTLGAIPLSQAGDSATFKVELSRFGVDVPTDTSTLRVETTAFAYDAAGNCGAATVPNTPLSDLCVLRGDTVYASQSGARSDLLLVRGGTIKPATATDRLADLAVDETGRRVFISNFSRNRVEVLPFGSQTFAQSIVVGAEPWGVTIGVGGDTLFVANSGGTNVSVVPLSTLQEAEALRIRPADIRLYGVEYDVTTDSIDVVTVHDYSDRPQFLGQISSGQLIYSTKPTSTREPGTIRIVDPAKDARREFNRGSEIFTGYAENEIGSGIVVNALSAGLTQSREMVVCPRAITASQADPGCVTGTATVVRDAIAALAAAGLTDTRVELGKEIESIGLTDTTFVAVSRDNSTISFGEGAVDPGRVFLFQNVAGALTGSSFETEDLLGNAAKRVIGLALNGDGSLGAARGELAYFFDDDLRLEGEAAAGTPTGGLALHPLSAGYPGGNATYRRAFVSAETATGLPYIDIIDTFSFVRVRRIVIRDRIIGTMAAAEVLPGDPEYGTVALRLFGITASGVLEVELTANDLLAPT